MRVNNQKYSQQKSVEWYLIIAVVFIVSSLANGYFGNDFSNIVTVAFGTLGSVFLAMAVYRASRND